MLLQFVRRESCTGRPNGWMHTSSTPLSARPQLSLPLMYRITTCRVKRSAVLLRTTYHVRPGSVAAAIK